MALFERDEEADTPLHTDPAREHALFIQGKVSFAYWARTVGYKASEVAQVMLVDDDNGAITGMEGRLH
jgi:hypothetical protein